MGTRNGISRYDGTSFKTFTSFLRGNKVKKVGHIFNMLPLENGGMWIGSYEDLFYFNTTSEKFYITGHKGGSLSVENAKVIYKLPENYYALPKEFKKDHLTLIFKAEPFHTFTCSYTCETTRY